MLNNVFYIELYDLIAIIWFPFFIRRSIDSFLHRMILVKISHLMYAAEVKSAMVKWKYIAPLLECVCKVHVVFEQK